MRRRILLAEHPFLERAINHDFPLHVAAEAFAIALDSDTYSKVLIRVGDFER